MTLTLASASIIPSMSAAGPSTAKRPAPVTSTTPNVSPAVKRPRTSDASASTSAGSVMDDGSDDECDGDGDLSMSGGNADQATREKVARKEARTIRNRESAQRSRNQRKAHLAWLEVRVKELEAENASLRGHSSSPGPSFADANRPSTSTPPPNAGPVTVQSLASDLGVPASVVSGAGVALASVAPPPRDLELMEDIKPVIPPSTLSAASLAAAPNQAARKRAITPAEAERVETELRTENAALRDRVLMLENLVKQVVAVSNLGGIAPSTSMASAGMADRASPTLFPASPINQPLPPSSAKVNGNGLSLPDTPLQLVTELDVASLGTTVPVPSSLPAPSFMMPTQPSTTQVNLSDAHSTLARHSAVVATPVLLNTKDEALQRARKHVIVPLNGHGVGNGLGFADAAFANIPSSGNGALVGHDGLSGQAGGAGHFGAGQTAGMDGNGFSFGNLEADADMGAFAFDFSSFSDDAGTEAFGAPAFAPLDDGVAQWDFSLSGPNDSMNSAQGEAEVSEATEDGWDVRMHRLIEDLESRVAGMEQEQQDGGVQGMGVLGLDLGLAGVNERRYEQWAS